MSAQLRLASAHSLALLKTRPVILASLPFCFFVLLPFAGRMSAKRANDGKSKALIGERKRLRASEVALRTSMKTDVASGTAAGESMPLARCSMAFYGTSGAHVSQHFPETGRIWQVQVQHVAQTARTFGIIRKWLLYKNGLRLKAGKSKAPSMERLEREDGVCVVLTGPEHDHGSETTASQGRDNE